ncbi:MAG: MBL fold metallo-hydrolase [Gemmatimonadota bacterium]|nr:MBL fold metallo-hydrolase [Gemmatimonadota bacterium]MDE3126482.1 MBL fold metallo-hydrolase [Gemmatimonadota bacterium]MDE3174236.1 MBL fold metallo-hydrolase [Gemmatimonadota bacterium]MDE3215463.1 MBL fold metallo-hydrolase [Gemmatimonadota bacterium]
MRPSSALLGFALAACAARGAPSGAARDDPHALTIRVLDVGQGDAIYLTNGGSRVIIDGGPDEARFGHLLDSLGVHHDTVDIVILTHAHADHYRGLRALFETARHVTVRYFFENADPSAAGSLRALRDSVAARAAEGSLVYRDTDDPCGDGRPICTLTLRGGAVLHVMRPDPARSTANDRSAPVKIVGADSASFTMWAAGDAETAAIAWFLGAAGYAADPGMRANVLKGDHHGSCNGVTPAYLAAVRPDAAVLSIGAVNDYGHMHDQAKAAYRAAGVPWYRTDRNGTITITSPGTPGGGYRIAASRPGTDLAGASDRAASPRGCGDDRRLPSPPG